MKNQTSTIRRGVLKTSVIAAAINITALLAPWTSVRAAETAKPVADFHVAPTGSDQNHGTADKPFATVDQARLAVRDAKAKQPERDYLVCIQPGLYPQNKTLVFGNEDSASEGHSITYAAVPGGSVILDGAAPLTRWEKPKTPPARLPASAVPHVLVAPMPEGLKDTRILYDAEGFLPRARSGKLEMDLKDRIKDNFDDVKFMTEQIPGGWSPRHAELSLVPMMWIHNYLPLAAWDPATRTLRFGAKTTLLRNSLHLGKNVGDWACSIENSLEFLDQPGEWVCDPDARLVYLWPRKEGSADSVRIPLLSEIVRVEGVVDHVGSNEKPVSGLRFVGLTFRGTDRVVRPPNVEHASILNQWELWDAPTAGLRFRSARNCEIKNCSFEWLGDTGLRLDLFSQGIVVDGCRFQNLGGTGVMAAGYGLGTKDVNKGNTISRCLIKTVGLITRSGMGLILWQSGENKILDNHIEDIPYTGMTLLGRASWERGYWPWEPGTTRQTEVDATLANLPAELANYLKTIPEEVRHLQIPALLHTRNNLIEHNRVINTVNASGDGNGIYIAGAGSGNILRENHVTKSGGQPLRCDDDQHGTVLERNVCVNTGMVCNKGGNTWRENIFWGQKGTWMFFMFGRISGETMSKNNQITRNIIVMPASKGDPFAVNSKMEKNFRQSKNDENIYWSKDATTRTLIESYFATARGYGHDKKSQILDPEFVDPDAGDFRFKPTSPLIPLGFKGVDTRTWGTGFFHLNPGFVKTDTTTANPKSQNK